jgi:hypothetical protein
MATGAITIDVDLRGFERWSSSAIVRQVPFATAKALTQLAVPARDKVRSDLPHHFHLRSGWTARGVQAVPARKSDYPNSFAVVGSRDEWMVIQETGGVKRPAHTDLLAIPTKRQTWRRSASGRMPKAQRPKALIRGGKAFQQGDLIMQRDPPFGVLYFLRPRAQLEARFEFRPTVETLVKARYSFVFRRALDDALRPRTR